MMLSLRMGTKFSRQAVFGQTLVEYAMLLVLVVVMAVGALGTLGGGLDKAWNGTMKPAMTSPEAPKVLAQQSAPSLGSIGGTKGGTAVSYDITGGDTASWDGQILNVNASSGDHGDCIPGAPPGAPGYCS